MRQVKQGKYKHRKDTHITINVRSAPAKDSITQLILRMTDKGMDQKLGAALMKSPCVALTSQKKRGNKNIKTQTFIHSHFSFLTIIS